MACILTVRVSSPNSVLSALESKYELLSSVLSVNSSELVIMSFLVLSSVGFPDGVAVGNSMASKTNAHTVGFIG